MISLHLVKSGLDAEPYYRMTPAKFHPMNPLSFHKQSNRSAKPNLLLGAIALGMGAILAANPARAAVLAGTASGTAIDVDINALGLASLGVGPLATAQVSAPAPDSQSGGVLSVNESVVLGSVVAQNGGDNALTASASSNVTGLATTGVSTGSSAVNNLAITVVPAVVPITPSLLMISSDTISSTSSSSGEFGSLTSTGATVLENLAIEVTGISVTIPVNPAPNTELVLAGLGIDAGIVAGLSIILNEQIVTGDGSGTTAITTNALRVELDALSLGLVSGVDGDIVIGSSTSSLTAVPEPAVPAFFGLASLLLTRRRRGQK